MTKQLRVDLNFSANTSAAKSAIQELNMSLSKIALGKIDTGINPEQIKKASTAAKELSMHLNNAYNSNTGRLDLSKLDKSLRASSANVKTLSHDLLQAGSQGQQAFVQLAQSIAAAERPMVGISARLKEFGTTLANTARWQISSSILHGFMSAVQSANSYAQDLNKSLNDIRIVTGQNVDQMAKFAEKANKAAKELSTTTTEYTNASLIYYQQGLSDEEVQKRTDITIKMANAAGQSAEVVSDQLTAVWNNFYDGTQSLEYYADVMTALGAATASSTDEIAGGLEKFAAIGETIGLSYEYAASALATITSNTRQSEEVVGTALKTIFARIQGLKLGETLDDGTSLNKYSEALQKVGISIFDQSGNLKAMDDILDEMGAKWDTLSKAQQTALAQTVAGVRQYTQLIALMENWDNGDNDSMMANLSTAYGSSGTLQEQADVYAESWEGARDRVQASLETIYSQLLDDSFFIGLNNGFASLLDSVGAFVDGLGGAKTLIIGIGTILMQSIAGKIQPMLIELGHNISVIFQGATYRANKMADQMNEAITQAIDADDQKKAINSQAGMSQQQRAVLEGTEQINKAKSNMLVVEKQLTAQEKQRYQMQLNIIQAQEEEAIAAAKVVDEQRKKIESTKQAWDFEKTEKVAEKDRGAEEQDLMNNLAAKKAAYKENSSEENLGAYNAALQELRAFQAGTDEARFTLEKYSTTLQQAYTEQMEFTQGTIENSSAFIDVSGILSGYSEKLQDLSTRLSSGNMGFVETKNAVESLRSEFQMATGNSLPEFASLFDKISIAANGAQLDAAIQELITKLTEAKIPAKDLEEILTKLGQGKTVKSMKQDYEEYGKAVNDAKDKQENLNKAVNNFNPKHVVSKIEAITKTASGLGQVAMAAQSCRSVFEAWENDDLSIGEKITSTVMGLSMTIPMLTSGLGQLIAGYQGTIGASLAMKAALKAEATQRFLNAAAIRLEQSEDTQAVATAISKLAVKKGIISADQQHLLTFNLMHGAKKINNAEDAKEILQNGILQAQKGKTIAQRWAELGVVTMDTLKTSENVVAKLALAGAEKLAALFGVTLTVAKKTETGAVIANTAAWYANPIMWIVAIVIAAVAAFGLLVFAIVKVTDSLNAEKKALEEAEEAEKRAAETAKKITEEANNISQALTNLESKTKAFKELEKGTLEWYKTLNEVNAEVQTLIDKFPELQAMGAITIDENGMLGITEEGKEYITQQTANMQATAQNTQIRATQNRLQAEVDYDWKTFGNDKDINGAQMRDEEAKALMASYQNYGDAMFTNAEYARAAFENMENSLGETFTYGTHTDEEIQKYLNEYKDQIIDTNSKMQEIDQLDKQAIQNRLSAYGSIRSVDQATELMGNSEFYSKTGEGNARTLNYTDKDGNEKSFNMNKSVNYKKDNLPQEIKDFMDMQGEDVEYVAQRNGKLVLEVDGEEVSFSEDEVYDALGELYSGEAFEQKLRENLKTSLGNAVSGIDNLSTTDLVNLDNLYVGIEEAFGGAEGAEEQAKKTFNAIVGAYGSTQADLERLSADTAYIDLTGPEFQGQVQALESGKITVEQFTQAMKEANAVGKIDSMGAWFSEQANSLGLDAEAAQDMQDYAKHLLDVADELDGLSDSLTTDADSAADLAVEITRMNKGIDTLADNFEDWNDILKKSSKGSAEYSKAMSGMKKAVADVIDVEADMISSEFITKHSEDIEKAATGDAAAIDRLRAAMDEDIIGQIKLARPDLTNLDSLDADVKSKLDAALDKLDVPDIEVGAILQDADFLAAANKLVEESGMTADQANAYFAGIGYEPVYNSEEIPDANTMSMPNAITTVGVTGIKWTQSNFSIGDMELPIKMPAIDIETRSTPLEPEPTDGPMTLTSFSGDGTPPKIQGLRKKATGSQNNYSSSNKGGKAPGSSKKSSSKPQKAETKKKSDFVERYKEIEDAISDIKEEMDDANRIANNLWGPKRIQQLEKNIELMKEEAKLLEKKKAESEAYLALDRAMLDQSARSLGFSIKYDADGDVLNGTKIQEALLKSYNNKVNSYNKGGLTDSEKEKLEDYEKLIEAFQDALDQYRETQQQVIDNQNAIEENAQNELEANATIFSEKFELEIELNDDELQYLDYYLSKTEDDFYQRAEGLAILGQQTGVYTQQLETQQAAWDELNQLKAEGKISDEFYMEQLNATKDSIYDNLEALQDLDKQMMEYYGETLQMASDEIDKVTDQMEHHNSVLEHYLSILELMGESANYKTIGVVLEGQAEVKKDRMIAAQKEWQMFQAETDAKYLAWKTATDEASAEMLKKQYEDALAISTEKQEEYLSLAEEYAESLKAILENSLLEYAQDLENALTGGTSFDQMNTKLERAAALQEEYLTTTNKIYETNKMMNTAQQELDKTINTIAKQRLKQFIDETNQLQKKNKLSQYELDIQQAKYDLLLAEIALEEAQNAKSSVRLQRDSEGNFGYVYTADQDKIADAQQKLADAQNSLYNIALEGSNDYFTKYQETLNEMYDTFTELHQQYLDGEFESEQEYQNAVAEAKAYYYELLEQYSDLYTIAISTDARALEDAWSSEFNSMVYNTKNWQTQVDIYIQRSQQSFSNYAKQIDTLAGELGVSGSYNEVANSVGNIVDQNEALLSTLLSPGGVFDTMEMEIALVNDVCAAYAVERATVLELIKTYEALALSIMNVKRVEAGEKPLGSLDLPTNNAEQDTAVPGSAKAGDGTPKVGDRVKYNSGKYYNSSDGSSPTGTAYQGSEVYITKINTADWAKYPYHISVGNQLYKGDLGWLKLNQISGYDTGGYTGRWGSYGKLAMLHEKEIVLNKQDTANFLQSMELLDNIVKTIDLYSANQQISGLLNSPSFGKLDSGTLEQTVTIDAHFPNVSSRVEIEEAFSTLINRASQYVNRN